MVGPRARRRSAMSKLACSCGGIISDSIYPSPTEGYILREYDEEEYYDRVSRDIAAFFRSIGDGERTAWIREFFAPSYPVTLSDESVIQDILTAHSRRLDLSVCECSTCGRLYVQRSR